MDAANNLGFIEKMLRKKHGFSLDPKFPTLYTGSL